MNKYMILTIALAISAGGFAQEYRYDDSGNLISDGNKQIASIHYNHLNLVDTIVYQDGRKILYAYTATGKKLRQHVLLADGTTKEKRDYDNGLMYERDTLREIQHADGRSVPVNPGQSTSSWEYQYHLKDHLGNVRSSLTSAPQTASAVASFEASAGTAGFLRYGNAQRVNALLFDHTRKVRSPQSTVHGGNAQIQETHYAQRLNGSANERYGIARSISVMPGDTVKMEVFAKYVDPNAINHNAALTTLLTQIAAGAAATGAVIDGPGYAAEATTPFPFAGLNNTAASKGSGPKGYLNWLVFNRDYSFRSGGYVQMTTVAKENGTNVSHEQLASTLAIDAPGYVYVYLSNEEATPLEVYFDDFAVTQVMSPVIQQTDYDPFGLTFNEYSRENTVPNRLQYNGKEFQNDFELNWSDYGARMYDAALGRWHVIDPMAETYNTFSPYNYVLNNPMKHIDPDGRNVQATVICETCEPLKKNSPMKEVRNSQAAKVVVTDADHLPQEIFVVYVDPGSKGRIVPKHEKINPKRSDKKGTVIYVDGKKVGAVPKDESGKDKKYEVVIVPVTPTGKAQLANAVVETVEQLGKITDKAQGMSRPQGPDIDTHFTIETTSVIPHSSPQQSPIDRAVQDEVGKKLQKDLDTGKLP